MAQINKVFVGPDNAVLGVHPYDQAVDPMAYGEDARIAFFAATDVDSPVTVERDEEGRIIGGSPRRLPDGWQDEHVPPLPDSVTSTQGQLALVESDKLDAMMDAIEALPDAKQKATARIKFNAATWIRSDPIWEVLFKAAKITASKQDALWRDAMAL